VISALNRSLPVSSKQALAPLIQTDTPINPGNSGGPLVDVRGRVVGITTAIMPFAQGLGFAVPSSTAYDVIGRLTETHRRSLSSSVMGISGLQCPLADRVVQHNQLEQRSGVLLLEIAPGSTAEHASLRSGDIILSIEGQPTKSVSELRQVIQRIKERPPWRITFLRDERRRQVSLLPHR
jgi:S1-C subfamily serine protease